MRRLIVFNHMSLDGYFTDANGDMRFAHSDKPDAEWDAFVAGNASGGGILLFGRITYELMASYWPTPAAAENMPVVAERMNNLPKVVFSRTLDQVSWNNTRLVKENIAGEIQSLKQQSGKDLFIFGSSDLSANLAQMGLIDEYRIMVNPLILGNGKPLLQGIKDRLPLKLLKTRTFRNGNVLLYYQPA